MKNAFGKSTEKTAEVVDQIPVIHLHGRLGFLPWQKAKSIVPFGAREVGAATMKIMLDEIKVVHEDITDVRDREFAKAKELLGQATRVYLLGFGFGARNVERLGLANVHADGYAGTTYGMTDRETAKCKTQCGGRVDLKLSYPALEFLRNVAALD